MRRSKLTWFLAGIVGTALSMGTATAHAQAAAWTGNLNLSLGMRYVDNDWDPVDNQFEMGVGVDMRQRNWPVSLAFSVSRSADESGDFEASIWQVDVGVKKIYDTANLPVTPFAGVGLSLLRGEVDVDLGPFGSVDDDDTALGIWLSGGAFVTLARQWNLGLELKYTLAQDMDFDLGGVSGSLDTNSLHWALLVGYHW